MNDTEGNNRRGDSMRGSDKEREGGSFLQNGLEHFNFSPKKIATYIGVIFVFWIVGSRLLGFIQGYNDVISKLNKQVHDAVPDTPFETPDGRTVTLYTQIRNMVFQIETLKNDVAPLKDKNEYEEVHDKIPIKKGSKR